MKVVILDKAHSAADPGSKLQPRLASTPDLRSYAACQG